MEKLLQREAYLKQARKQKEIVMHYIRDGRIVFADIEETITESTRIVFLQWIAQANMNSQKIGRTEYGQEYRMIPEKRNLCIAMRRRRAGHAVLCIGV